MGHMCGNRVGRGVRLRRVLEPGFAVLVAALMVSACAAQSVSIPGPSSSKTATFDPSRTTVSALSTAAGKATLGAPVGELSGRRQSTATSAVSTPLGGPAALELAGAVPCSARTQPSAGVVATTGTVYYDVNQNGKRDVGEPGLVGIPIYMANGPDAETPATDKTPATCTDHLGNFALSPPDTHTRYQVWVRTGWFRTQCPALTCAIGSEGDNVQTGPEWIYSRNFVTGKEPRAYMIGLIPDAGQHVESIRSKAYLDYPPDLSKAHRVDLAARFTDDQSVGCQTTKNGVNCRLGGAIAQTLYIVNSGLTSVSGIRGVMQVPYEEVHRKLSLLSSGTSPGILSLSDVNVAPALRAAIPGETPTMANYTTITFTLNGTIPPGGFVSVLSDGVLAHGTPGMQIVGRAGITGEDHAEADKDSGFCPTPAVPTTGCMWISDTHSLLDLHGDDTDSDRFNIVK